MFLWSCKGKTAAKTAGHIYFMTIITSRRTIFLLNSKTYRYGRSFRPYYFFDVFLDVFYILIFPSNSTQWVNCNFFN